MKTHPDAADGEAVGSTVRYMYLIRVEDGEVAETVHSPTATAITGYAPEDFEKNDYLWLDMVHEDDRPAVIELADSILRSRDPLRLEHRIRRRDGQVRWVANLLVPRFDDDGKLVSIAGLLRDITDEKKAQDELRQRSGRLEALVEKKAEELRESEERLRLVLEATADGVWDADLAGGENYLNDNWARMLGYEPEEIRSDHDAWVDMIHPDDRARTQAAYRAHLEGESERYECEYRMRNKAGAYQWILSRGKVVSRDASGLPRRMVGTHTDISRLKETEAQLNEYASRMESLAEERARALMHAERLALLGTMAAEIAHEITSPLGTIDSFVQLLEIYAETLDPVLAQADQCEGANREDIARLREEMPDALARIRRSLNRMSRLVRRLQRFSRKEENHRESTDINRCVEEAVQLCEGLLKYRHAELFLADGLPPVVASSQKLEQVFVNLLTNAAQALPEGKAGRIEVRTEGAGEAVRITVDDDGPGVPEKNREHVWEAFYTTKAPDKGTGLGLSITRKIVAEHGGDIRLETSPLGGARFVVELPVYHDPGAAGAAPETP